MMKNFKREISYSFDVSLPFQEEKKNFARARYILHICTVFDLEVYPKISFYIKLSVSDLNMLGWKSSEEKKVVHGTVLVLDWSPKTK